MKSRLSFALVLTAALFTMACADMVNPFYHLP